MYDFLHNKYYLPIFIEVIKLRRIFWAGNIVDMEKKGNVRIILSRKYEGLKVLEISTSI
jgi:hypothetical protein